MRLALLSDDAQKNKDIKSFVENVPSHHSMVVLSTEDILQDRFLGDYDMVFVNRRTWQESYSIIKYFGKLKPFEKTHFYVLTRSKKLSPLKGRLGKKDFSINVPIHPENIDKTLEALFQEKQESYSSR